MRGDRGSASVVMLGVGLAVFLLTIGFVSAEGVVIARHRARNAADAGALAGALSAVRGSAGACAEAARLVAANGGRLASCKVAGPVVTVDVEVRAPVGLTASATARAGPVMAA
ncbi:Rv3654c family TadE-like protein [Dactylosporangium sp. CA-139066]|uniref:Rv3654c family TadE-like protein n=1 Tax=Dactylosporangium sp. CA-139066 TaxID=3239930 RepID=UPI003D8ECB4F